MAIENEVFGSCVGEIDVSVVVKCGDAWLCCGWNYLVFILAGKAAQDWQRRRVYGARYWGSFLVLWA